VSAEVELWMLEGSELCLCFQYSVVVVMFSCVANVVSTSGNYSYTEARQCYSFVH